MDDFLVLKSYVNVLKVNFNVLKAVNLHKAKKTSQVWILLLEMEVEIIYQMQ